jgi:hypothetical protein
MKRKDLNDFRHEAIAGLIGYQELKYDLSKIIPLQSKYSSLSFREDVCYIGLTKLEETTYICDAALPNIELKNVQLEANKINGTWQIIMKINFFGLSLCVYHTKEKQFYFVGIPDNFTPRFKIICREDDPLLKRKDSMV